MIPARERLTRTALVAVGVCALAVSTIPPVEAHKPVTSRYTFTEDVYPIVKEHCGGCHAPGGVAPMSLLSYDDARPWAESIRLELTSGHMPPWFGDTAFAPLKDARKLSPRDIDVILTWATGGTPPGPAATKSQAAGSIKSAWRRGRPDLVLPLPAPFNLPAGKAEDIQEFVLQPTNDRDRWVAAADLLPGNPAIVHDAVIYTKAPGSADENVLAVWVPASTPVVSAGVGFRWRAGEQLGVRVHYKKTWKYENKPASDRSTVGLYTMKTAAAREMRSLPVPLTGATLDEGADVFALRTADAPSDVDLRVEVVRPDGSRMAIGGFTTRAGWEQRYWLARPLALLKGSRVEVTSSGAPASALRLFMDVVRATS